MRINIVTMQIFHKLFLVVSLISSLVITGCDNSSNVVEQKKKTLVMGTTADYPPFEFIKDKKIRGFDIDLANMIVKKLGYTVYIRDMHFDSLIPALQTQRIDFAISGFSSTPEREKHVDLSIPYYIPTFAIIYNKDNSVATVEDLKNKTIATQLGSTMEIYLKEKAQTTENLKIISLARVPAMIQELKLKRLDGVMVEAAQAQVFANKYKELEYTLFSNTGEGYSVAFPKGSDLKEQFNDVIAQLRDSGELDKLKKKWLF